MRLVPAYAGDSPGSATAGPPGTLRVSAETQQLIGVRTAEVVKSPTSHLLRVPGRITVDDARLYRIVAAADGWIRELGQNTVGTFVAKDQVLASYYTSNLLAGSQTLLYAMATNEQSGPGYLGTQRGPTTLSLQVAVDTLRSLGMSEAQIAEIQRTRQAASLIRITSPISGFVLARNISPEQRFDKGAELFRIGDIGHVWVVTDIFEKDSQFVRPGSLATVRYGGREFPARMSDVLQQLDPESRTLKTRFELDNPGYFLRPDMFVDVEIQVNLPAAVTVPADSVINSGLRKTVFVERGGGEFEPRLVETGWRLGDRIQITEGLKPGERIVVSGNFLIDSETRMKLAALNSPAATADRASETDPVCGMDVDPKAPNAIRAQYRGKTYTFCSPKCKQDFEAAPAKYISAKRGPA
jgi:multidrug efflux pump subunit AcrA (membrane-fusion protein)/YHS domain-containing protein